MKGLSIGRTELVNRFLSNERQRLSRSVESASFGAEMRHQSNLLTGRGLHGPRPAALFGHETAGVPKRLNGRFSRFPRTVLNGEKSEKAELEIADPLLLQEILAELSATPETRKKAADRTGDEGAFPVQELIALLEHTENNSLSDDSSEQKIPAEFLARLLNAMRWSDNKRKAVVPADNLMGRDAYDRQALVETLKNFLRNAETQRDAFIDGHSCESSYSLSDVGSPQDTIGAVGMADAVPEDFLSPWHSTPFSLWQSPRDEQESQDPGSQKTGAGATNTPRAVSFRGAEDRRPLEGALFMPASMLTDRDKTLVEPPFPRRGGVIEEALRTFGPQGPLQDQAFARTAASVLTDEPAPPALSSLGDSFFPEEDPAPFGAPGAAFQTTGAPLDETISHDLHTLATSPPEGSADTAAAFLEAAGEGQERVLDFSQPWDVEGSDNVFTEESLLVHDLGNGSGSSPGDSTPFGESPSHGDGDFSRMLPHGPGQGSAVSEITAPRASRSAHSDSATTLSLLNADWPRELARKLSHWVRSGKSFMTLELQPESLGKLFLRVETDGTRVSAVLQTESPEVREMLQRNMTSLRDVLAENGLHLKRFSVDVRHENPSFANRDLAPWMHEERKTPSLSFQGGEGENVVNVLQVYDAGLGRALSVRV